MPDEIQPQDTELKEGAVATPVVVQPPPPEPAKPGAEEQPKVAGPAVIRTYSQEEWSKRESSKDQEVAALRRQVEQATMQSQIAEAQRFEREAASRDLQAVNEGSMTQEGASQNAELRQRQMQLYFTQVQVRSEQEDLARTKVAQEIAKKYGVDANVLLSDKDIKSPTDMIDRAASLAHKTKDEKIEQLMAELKALKEGEPQFDRGQSGTTGPIFDKMGAEEKITWALAHPQRKR